MGNMTKELIRGNFNMKMWDNLQDNDERLARVQEVVEMVQKFGGMSIEWDYEGRTKREQANIALIEYLPTAWEKLIDEYGILHIWDSTITIG